MPKVLTEVSVGDRFGCLTIVRTELRGKNSVVITQCDCGRERVFWKKSAVKHQRSCGCGIDSFGLTGKQRRSWNLRLQGYLSGAKKRGYTWELSFQDFVRIASQPCTFCGTPAKEWECFSNAPSIRKDSPQADSELYKIKISGVDRLDNSLGYTISNSVPCCVYCNRAKSDLSFKEFEEHVGRMYQWLSQKHKELR